VFLLGSATTPCSLSVDSTLPALLDRCGALAAKLGASRTTTSTASNRRPSDGDGNGEDDDDDEDEDAGRAETRVRVKSPRPPSMKISAKDVVLHKDQLEAFRTHLYDHDEHLIELHSRNLQRQVARILKGGSRQCGLAVVDGEYLVAARDVAPDHPYVGLRGQKELVATRKLGKMMVLGLALGRYTCPIAAASDPRGPHNIVAINKSFPLLLPRRTPRHSHDPSRTFFSLVLAVGAMISAPWRTKPSSPARR